MKDYDFDPEKIRRILELAKCANNQQDPDRAIALVSSSGLDGSQTGLEKEWIESRLILAEAYTAKGSSLAEPMFEETVELLKRSEIEDVAIESRVHEHFGDYLRRFAKRPSLARQEYEIAKSKILQLKLDEDSARVQLKLESIELDMDKSPELENFVTFKRVAKRLGCTCAQQLVAWLSHKGQIAQHQDGLRFARSKAKAGEAYFEHILERVRMKV